MKNFQKYPKWLKDEYVERAIEKFANRKARVVLNNERLFIIDLKWENGDAVNEMRYIWDKERGVFTLYGDLGEAIAYFNRPVEVEDLEVEDLLSYLYMCSYDLFEEKIATSNPYYIDSMLGTIEKEYLWVMGFFMACEDAGLRGWSYDA